MDIAVPYHEKDLAKTLGAKWNAVKRTWYVPPGVDINLFKRWSPEIEKWDKLTDGKGSCHCPAKRTASVKDRSRGRSASSIRDRAITGKQYAPRECAACSTIAPWEPQCSTCTEHFQRPTRTTHSSCGALERGVALFRKALAEEGRPWQSSGRKCFPREGHRGAPPSRPEPALRRA